MHLSRLHDRCQLIIPAWAILVAIQSLRPCWVERDDPNLLLYHEKVALAISEEAEDVDDAAALISIAKNESGLCQWVQAKKRGPASSAWQLEGKTRLYQGPFVGLDYEPIHNAAHAAVDVWHHTGGCGNGIAGHFSVYAGGGRCGKDWPSLRARVSVYWFVYQRITKEIQNGAT